VADESVVTAVRQYLKALQEGGLPVRFGVVFGSQVAGRAERWSDIDLVVVSPRFDGKVSRRDVDLLWRLAARLDSRIEPIPCGERQWRDGNSSIIIDVARREGETILPSEAA